MKRERTPGHPATHLLRRLWKSLMPLRDVGPRVPETTVTPPRAHRASTPGTAEVSREATGAKPAPDAKPPHRTDPRLLELKLASTPRQRREAAWRHPDLRPPHACLTFRDNQILKLAYWQGQTYREIGVQLGFSAGRASQVCARALSKLDAHLHRGGSLGMTALPEHRLTDLRKAHAIPARLEVARRHPELRPPHPCLQEQENGVLERFYWQGQTFDEIARHYHLTRKQAREVRDHALQKLDMHYRRTRVQEQARRALPQETQEDRVSRANDPTSSPLVVLGEDARITAFLRAGPAEKRWSVAQHHPELRPPQLCLSRDENDLLELAFWQARTYREIAELNNLARRDVGTRIRKALKKLDQHLHGEPHEDEDRLGEVLLALNECGSVRQAAKRLELPKDVVRAFMEREDIKARFVFEVEP